ncbi:MAG: peptidase M50, partial [Myxococcota bacterium]
MTDRQHSSLWYRVAELKPGLRGTVQFHRHLYRGQLWYVVQDPNSGRCHRIAPEAYRVAGLMNGERTTQEIWDLANEQLGDAAPTQDETIRLLGLLHGAHALNTDATADTGEMLLGFQRSEHAEWWQRILHPLSLRVPLFDPDAFLERWVEWARPFFTRTGLVVWLFAVLAGAAIAVSHSTELAEGASHELLDPRNLLIVSLLYPLVKGLHELGHGFATKVWGGEVHEMGVMFLVFVPVPYVDASASAAFQEKTRRMAVAGAGIAVELFIATIALFVWVATEPSLVRTIAYNTIWISGLSTLLFNGNPLLKFDGYFVLCDALEVPNLGPRAQQYLGYLALHYGLGMERVRYPVQNPSERPWLVAYGIAAFVYRFVLVFTIALFVAGRFFAVGILLAVVCVVGQIVVPVIRQATLMLTSPRFGERRARTLATSAAFVVLLGLGVLVLPLPLMTTAEGVVWPPPNTEVRAGADGFVLELLATPGATVSSGDPLIRMQDRALETQIQVLDARRRELKARRYAELGSSRVRAQMTEDELATVDASIALARQRAAEGIVRSPADGAFVVPDGQELIERYVNQGDLLGYVVQPPIRTVRVVMSQADVALVRNATRSVEVRLARELETEWPARIQREVPGAGRRLPH